MTAEKNFELYLTTPATEPLPPPIPAPLKQDSQMTTKKAVQKLNQNPNQEEVPIDKESQMNQMPPQMPSDTGSVPVEQRPTKKEKK